MSRQCGMEKWIMILPTCHKFAEERHPGEMSFAQLSTIYMTRNSRKNIQWFVYSFYDIILAAEIDFLDCSVILQLISNEST